MSTQPDERSSLRLPWRYGKPNSRGVTTEQQELLPSVNPQNSVVTSSVGVAAIAQY
ncbi:MAG: hypothetical protein HC857_14060 [Synechococcales cyanobacterium RU_4_20]|nr:hypothetical protein [Synechococcales cyanobacterium RU_4_20]NJR69009.1 hypothetical protein [Synechococcales cyanobacterium CRU_2_2]